MDKKSGSNNRWVFVLIGFILVISAFVIFIIFLLRGETNFDHSDGSVETSKSVICESSGIDYPFLTYDGGKTILVKVFYDEKNLTSISLVYKEVSGEAYITHNRINAITSIMANTFIDDGLSFDALGINLTGLSDGVQMHIIAENSELNNTTAKYFMIDELAGHYSMESISKAYESKGFSCVTND